MNRLANVTINDLKLVFRDKSLRLFFGIPVMIVLFVRFVMPEALIRFDVLKTYIPYILMIMTTQGVGVFGFIYSMVLINEKDTLVAKTYGVLPVSKIGFVITRMAAPFMFSTITTFFILFFEPFYRIPVHWNIVYSALVGLVAPIVVLFVTIFSKNKIEGMTWNKLSGMPVALPLLSFFVPAYFAPVFAVFPTYWAYQGLSKMIANESFAAYVSIGYGLSFLLIWLMAKRFASIHFH